jgi:hypothetical protein
VRFAEGPDIIQRCVFCRQLETRTVGADIFAGVNTWFQEEGLLWSNCMSVCSDGAAAMIGHVKGFLSFAQKETLYLVTTHCFLHREARTMKSTDGKRLGLVFKTIMNMINYIKSHPIKCKLFRKTMPRNGSRILNIDVAH